MNFTQLKDQATEFIKPYYETAEDFFLDMTFDLAHDYLFLTRHFPLFFILQTVFICYIIRLHSPRAEPKQSFITSGGMVLLGRILTAYFTHRPPVLFENVFYAPIFILIWLLMNYFPFDLLYKIISFGPFAFALEIFYSLVQVRESCHGVDIGLRAFPASAVGAILLSSVLASTESLIWLMKNHTTRNFSTTMIVRNLLTSTLYFIITNYPELFNEYIPTEREPVKIYILVIYIFIAIMNMLVFGLRSRKYLL